MLQNSSIIRKNYIQPNHISMNKMRMFIKSIDGEIFSFFLKNHDLIRDIKMKIYDKIGLNVKEQILFFQGEILDDMMTLNDYEIINDSLIEVVGRLRGGMQIVIKKRDGSTIDIDIDNVDNIRNLKHKIQKETEIPVSKQILVYKGLILENNKTIEKYQICEKSEINLVVKLKNEEIKISAKTSDGKTVEIEIGKSDKIFDLKCLIEEKLGLSADKQKLFCQGVILDDDDQTIDKYQICNQSEIDILAKILISITTSGGRIATVEIYERDKIKDLKYQIEEKLSLNLNKQILVFEERILDDDDKSIGEYGICDRSMIHLRCSEIEISVIRPIKNFCFDALISDKIRDIKKKMEHESGIPPNEQLIKYKNEILNDDNKTIYEYGLCDSPEICLIRNFQVFVKISEKRTISVAVNDTDKIEVLKHEIENKTGIKSTEQNLIYESVTLDNDKTIGFYDIKTTSFINIVSKLRGGKCVLVIQSEFYLTSRKENLEFETIFEFL